MEVTQVLKNQGKKCKHCKKKVVEALDCIICACSFHPSCAAQANVLEKSGKVNCCDIAISEVKSSQKTRKNSENSEIPLGMDEKKLKQIIDQSLKQMFQPIEAKMDKKFQDLEKSVQFMSNCFEEQKAEYHRALQEIKVLKKENISLKERILVLESKMDSIESKERANNMIIVGVPKQTIQEKQIVLKILNSINVQVPEDEILEGTRLKKREEGPILVKFRNSHIKPEIFRRIKQLKGTTVRRCGLEGQDQKIYLNDDLTFKKRELFRLVRETKQKNGYKAAFISNGNIYIKKNEQDAPIKVLSEEDL